MLPLQEQFLQSDGKPVLVGDRLVQQSATLDIADGSFTLRFLSGQREGHGIRAKTKDGWIELSDGTRTKVLDTWFSPDLPDHVTHRFHCRQGVLRLWNTYRTRHPSGDVTQDMWTGNAGMVLLDEGPQRRTYGCSRGDGPFDPGSLVVEITWNEAAIRYALSAP